MNNICAQAEEWLTLTFLPGLGCALLNRLLLHFGTPRKVLEAGAELQAVSGLGPHTRRLLIDPANRAAARQRAAAELERLKQTDDFLLSLTSPEYPQSLRTLPDPPVLLYARGKPGCLAAPSVALVGSRSATAYGRRVSATLAGELAGQGLTVVSGGAYGIDAAAHQGALDAGGRTAAVFGCGLDVVYPHTHSPLFAEIAEQGVLLSEYPLGTRPEGFRFPARNRIISGLAAGVVVVEATPKSGSLITARLALDQGREVFAVPGRVDSVKSRGCHALIQQGAQLVETAADVLAELMLGAGQGHEPGARALSADALPADQDEAEPLQEERILSCLEVYPVDIDTLLRVTAIPVQRIHGLLLQLELKGRIRQVAGQQYEKIP
ncbi:DNA-processing protein DprA [Desulfogranum mediterraneum]|uniref:DNA-processing protein DprA n=1 Tax=Desulfogranum mediterraneum TaxID=160661 RepID=UPI0003F5228F|nr:DNA-processing protein DprA [Desulfogranum mediterraneum]